MSQLHSVCHASLPSKLCLLQVLQASTVCHSFAAKTVSQHLLWAAMYCQLSLTRVAHTLKMLPAFVLVLAARGHVLCIESHAVCAAGAGKTTLMDVIAGRKTAASQETYWSTAGPSSKPAGHGR